MAPELPVPEQIISRTFSTSRPFCCAKESASAMPTMELARATWLESFAAWPLPAPPKQKILEVKVSSTSRTGSMSRSVAPTMAVRVPAMAPPSPPVTGQSKACLPQTSAAPAMSRASSGALVVRSIRYAPSLADASRPSPAR